MPDTVLPWETGPDQLLLDTRVLAVYGRTARSRQSDKAGTFYWMKMPDWVNVVAITPARELVLIEQYRHGLDRVTLEIPGGTIDPGEAPLAAGVRELVEETGYAGDAELIGVVSPNPALQANWCHTLRVREARVVAPPRFDGHEEIALRLVPIAELPELIRSGRIHHALVVAALMHAALAGSW